MGKSVLVVLLAFAACALAVQYESCGGTYGSLRYVSLSPSPLVLKEGKQITADYKLVVAKKFPDAIDVKLTIEKKILWFYQDICGIAEAGSGQKICSHHLTCDMMNKLQANNAVKYPCPSPIGVYAKKLTVAVPKFDAGAVANFFGSGKYRVTIELRSGNQILACAKISDLEIEL